MKYLLQAIETSRHRVDLSDADLTKLLTDVQKSRDDRTLLHDSLERLLHDLRAQSHAQAFLARVNKRDAPDYYDVIKNPMDLGLMLKNVKSGKYRSKEAFRKDLDLIWDNCLLYNNEPTHPLRISANLMRKRSHDLLSYIQDSHDVKSALSEWIATHTSLTPAEAKALQRADTAAVPGITQSTSPNFLGPVAAATSSTPSAQHSGPSIPSPIFKVPLRAGLSSLVEEKPFEDQRAFTVGSGLSLAEEAAVAKRKGERDHWVLRNALGGQWSPAYPSETSRGKRKMVVQPIFEEENDDAEVEEIVRSLSEGNAVDVGSSFSGVGGPTTAHRVGFAIPRLKQSTLTQAPCPSSALRKGHSRQNGATRRGEGGIFRTQVNNDHSLILNGGSPSAAQDNHMASQRRRAVDCMKRNIKAHRRMYRLKRKFDYLDHCIDNDQPLPSSLLIDSDEETEGLVTASRRDDVDAKPNNGTWSSSQWDSSSRQGPSLHVNGLDKSGSFDGGDGDPSPSSSGPASHPFSHISLAEARSTLQSRISLLCGNAGFSSSHSRPLDILTSVLEEFLCSLGRSLRLYLDRYASTTMSAEEILLHTLHATSSVGPNELDKYLFEDTMRYSHRLEDLKRKMEYSWKERIALGEEKLVSEEDARFFGAEGSEDLMVGNIPSALDDDFFGFKALGLDQELGVANLTIPARLFRGRGGVAGRRAGEVGGVGKEKEGEKEAFPSPPPFIRISECSLPAQIGLLRGFYRDVLHRRGHRGREKRQHQPREGTADADDEAEEEDEEDDYEGMLEISDDEAERTTGGVSGVGGGGGSRGGGGGQFPAGLKIGQSGIMPKRDFWVDPNRILARTAAGAGGGSTASSNTASTTLLASSTTGGSAGPGGSASVAYAAKGGGSGSGTTGKSRGGGGAAGKKGRSKKDG